MCGIAGWLGVWPDSEKCAKQFIRALRHRGPDGDGIRSWPDAALIHTRLSIIDLSSAGAQPMANERGTVWTVFNGEIYNHRQLRQRLEAKGHVFRSKSDTEVIPLLYEELGPQFVQELRGMFALAIYDTQRRRLILVRDRFGIKPLFYASGKDRFVFASEIGALKDLPNVDIGLDRQALYDFTALSYIPAPETFYSGIRALEPGQMLDVVLDSGGISCSSRRYHSWKIAPDPDMTLNHATDRAEELITIAVQRQLESDVSLGALLSGGIDSSLVSAAAQVASHGELRTFNVRFSGKQYDETWAAAMVARHIGSRHESLDMSELRKNWNSVTDLFNHLGQPFADTSVFAVNAICKLMRQHIKVAISGDGGDEAFGGYDVYWRLARIALLQRLPTFFSNYAATAGAELSRYRVLSSRFSQRLQEVKDADDVSVIQSLFSIMGEREHKCLQTDSNLLPVRRLFESQWQYEGPKKTSRIERLSAHATEVNVRLTLPNDFLYKVDIASMMEGLEVRVPMLDEELFTFGLSIPHHLKVKGRTCKRILRSVAARRLPPAVAKKPKWGFSVPLESWLGAELRAQIREFLLDTSSRLPEFFRPQVFRPWIDALADRSACPELSKDELYPRVIMLLSAQLALQRTA